jgi:hypothetical protein
MSHPPVRSAAAVAQYLTAKENLDELLLGAIDFYWMD